MTRVLIDYHHADLWESWQLMMVDRWGWDLFAPYGMDWFDSGIWNFERAWHGDAIARQYLEGVWTDVTDHGNHVERPDGTHPGRTIRGVTLEQARSQPWDVVIATVPDNEPGLARFAREVGAKYGAQIGNQWQTTNWDAADFGLVSATLDRTPPKPHVVYRQPFSLDLFAPTPPPRGDRLVVASFVQCLPENPRAYAEFREYAAAAPQHDWRIYGSYGSHPTDEYAAGNLYPTPAVARGMQAADVIWHTKEWSDGFGHVIHNAFAVGRPVFGHYGYYHDKMAGPLWVDGETSIDLGRRGRGDVLAELDRIAADPERHAAYCAASARRFREVVDFDAEAAEIAAMFERVLA